MPALYLFKKIIESIPTLVGVTLVTFLLLKLAPGDPVYYLVGERVTQDRIDSIRQKYHLDDKGWGSQYILYIKNVFQGGMGRSYITNKTVISSFAERFPNTLRLALFSIIISIFSGITLGIVSACVKMPFWNQILTFLTTFGISTPVFWFGLFLIYIFSRWLQVLPASGVGNGEIAYLILPAITLGSRSAAYLARMTKTSMESVKEARYIGAARGRGIHPVSIIMRHSLKNALIPIITLIGLDFGSYLNGSVLTETIFGWNGVGSYIVMAINQRDYPVIMGGILLGTIIFIGVNIWIDFLYTLFDPRIELK